MTPDEIQAAIDAGHTVRAVIDGEPSNWIAIRTCNLGCILAVEGDQPVIFLGQRIGELNPWDDKRVTYILDEDNNA